MAANQQQSAGLSIKARAFSVTNLIRSPPSSSKENFEKEEEKVHQEPSHNCDVIDVFKDPTTFKDLNRSWTENVTVELLCGDLWREFHSLGTEMIITKAGRRMFPSLKVRLSGLEENALYLIYIEMEPVDDKRYRYVYQSSKWIPGGPADIPHHEQRFLHPDGPQLGKFWNKQNCVAFEKLKLTNSRKPSQRDQIMLHSMHRYQPKLCIQSIPLSCKETCNLNSAPHWWKSLQFGINSTAFFSFPETEFITVTAYQNQQITRLKIASNPFAKGFRETIHREPRNLKPRDSQDSIGKKLRLTSNEEETRLNVPTYHFPSMDIHSAGFEFNAVHHQSAFATSSMHQMWFHHFAVLHQPSITYSPCVPYYHSEELNELK